MTTEKICSCNLIEFFNFFCLKLFSLFFIKKYNVISVSFTHLICLLSVTNKFYDESQKVIYIIFRFIVTFAKIRTLGDLVPQVIGSGLQPYFHYWMSGNNFIAAQLQINRYLQSHNCGQMWYAGWHWREK